MQQEHTTTVPQQGVKGLFNPKAQAVHIPATPVYNLPLENGHAVFRRNDNHGNRAARGTWENVEIHVAGRKFSYDNFESLKEQTTRLTGRDHDLAQDFRAVLNKYMVLNSVSYNQKTKPKMNA